MYLECFLFKVSLENFTSSRAVEVIYHKLLDFLSGNFKGAQLKWSMIDEEDYAGGSGFRWLRGWFTQVWPF